MINKHVKIIALVDGWLKIDKYSSPNKLQKINIREI